MQGAGVPHRVVVTGVGVVTPIGTTVPEFWAGCKRGQLGISPLDGFDLADLKIESLDLAMIVFDIEDTFAIEIPYNANEEAADFKTVGSVVDRVRALIAGSGAAAAKA